MRFGAGEVPTASDWGGALQGRSTGRGTPPRVRGAILARYGARGQHAATTGAWHLPVSFWLATMARLHGGRYEAVNHRITVVLRLRAQRRKSVKL